MFLSRITLLIAILFTAASFTAGQDLNANDDSWLFFTAAADRWNIYRMRLNGSGLQNLTPNSDNSGILALSPDQQWIYFGEADVLYRMRIDGSERQRLLTHDGQLTFHTLSPDSEWFFITWNFRANQIYRVRSDGSEKTRLDFPVPYFPTSYSWSPDGQWLFFAAEPPELPGIYRMSSDGNIIEKIISNSLDTEPDFYEFQTYESYSPDGEWLLFGCVNQHLSICRMRYDGSQLQELTPFKSASIFTSWSPDREWIYFYGDPIESGMPDLYRMRPDGKDVQRVTDFSIRTDFVGFTPDGDQMLIWVGEIGTTRDLYRMNLDGSESEFLFSSDRIYRLRTSSPDGKWMIFSDGDFHRVNTESFMIENITNNPGTYWDVGWSPDGAWLFYTFGNTPYAGVLSGYLYRININTLEVQQLTPEVLTYSFGDFYFIDEG